MNLPCGGGVIRQGRGMAIRARDIQFMQLALREARKGVGHTSPNPAVGAVVVRKGEVIATGYHRRAGLPHAEIEALRKVSNAKGATLYVTLEPCSTHGRTPPCVEAILAAGIRKVVVGATDPNPRHAGRGFQWLRSRGVTVDEGVLAAECAELNRGFNHWIQHGVPYVIAKCGMSLDARLTRPPTEGQWITSPRSRVHAMKLRANVDAVLVGGETVRQDNPRLTVRRGTREVARQPWRVIVSKSGNLPASAHLFTDAFKDRTVVFVGKSLPNVLRELGRRGVTSVLIEGGMRTLGEAFDERLVQEVRFYLAPVLLGGPILCVGGTGVAQSAKALRIETPRYERVGPDLCLSGRLVS